MSNVLHRTLDAVGKLLGQPIQVNTPEPKRRFRKPKFVRATDLFTPEFIASKEFLKRWEWRSLAYDALEYYGPRCMMCGRTPAKHGIAVNVDHIKSRRDWPERALDPDNLQILCDEHNHGKGNRHSDDWR